MKAYKRQEQEITGECIYVEFNGMKLSLHETPCGLKIVGCGIFDELQIVPQTANSIVIKHTKNNSEQ